MNKSRNLYCHGIRQSEQESECHVKGMSAILSHLLHLLDIGSWLVGRLCMCVCVFLFDSTMGNNLRAVVIDTLSFSFAILYLQLYTNTNVIQFN